TVRFDSDGGSACSPVSVYKGDKVDHFPEPTRANSRFLGWFLLDEDGAFAKDDAGNDIEVNVLTPIDRNIDVRAKWESYVTVSFDSDGGSACNPISVRRGRRITSWPTPNKSGFVFKGWYLTATDAQTGGPVIAEPETRVDSETVIDEDMTVMAKWGRRFTVTFNWTDYKDKDGNPVITTETVEEGKTVSKLPGMYRGGFVVLGWYPDAAFAGDPLTDATQIHADATYYAKWGPSAITVEQDNIEFQYNIVWTNASTGELVNANDCLSWYVPGSKGGTVEAHASIDFALIKTNGLKLPPQSVQLQVPKYVFAASLDQPLKTGVSDNAVTFIPEAPYQSKGMGWNYVDMGDYYLLQNTEPTENLTLDIDLTYTVKDFKKVFGARIDAETGDHLDARGDLLENDPYAPKDNPFVISIKTTGVNIERTKNLRTAAYKTYTRTTYSASYGVGRASVRRAWDGAWGDRPADADDYYYVVWTHGGFSVSASGSFAVNTAGLFETTSKSWVEDHYDVVYEAPDYIVTRHAYSELTDNRTTLYKKERLEGQWASGAKEYAEGTIECRIDFTVGDPASPQPSTDGKTGLTASKYRYYSHAAPDYDVGQDQLLDDERITFSGFTLHMTGPGPERLAQKGDTSLYVAKAYTMVIRDGDSGDITYNSSRANRPAYLGDNDYRFTRLSIALSNWDGYQDTNGWHSLANTAYSSWQPVEVWLREKGKTEFYKYTDVTFTSGASKAVVLPENTVGFEVRYGTAYAGTSLYVYPTMQILPSPHVKRLVQADYLARVNTYFYNRASFAAVDDETGDAFGSWTDGDNAFSLGKSKTGLKVVKSVGEITNYKNTRIQTAEITVTGSHVNVPGRTKPIYAGVFYELLPLDTQVDESTVWVEAGSRLNRSMVNVEFVQDWKGTKQTMMIVSVGGIPEKTRSSSVALHYTLATTYENIITRGASMYSPSAFANTSSAREIYEIAKSKNIKQIAGGQAYFGDLEERAEYGGIGTDGKTVKGQYIAYDAQTVRYLSINAFSSGFSKAVSTLGAYVDSAEIVAQREYTYRLTYGQSNNAQSDNIVLYDLLDRGRIENEYSAWNGHSSQWQGRFVDIHIPQIKSTVNGVKTICAPVVYYSTSDAADISALSKDLSDPSVWTTERPDDPVTAVAVDFRAAQDGGKFILAGQDSIVVYITMAAPADEALNGKTAINTALSEARLSGVGDDPEIVGHPSSVSDQTAVTMKAVEPEITLTADPGTSREDTTLSKSADNPRLMAYKDTLTYDIAVRNPDPDFTYNNIEIVDKLPLDMVTVEKSNISVYVGDDRAHAVKIGSSPRVSMAEGEDGRLTFTVHELLPGGWIAEGEARTPYKGETLHIVIPCIVETREGRFENEAALTAVNGLVKDLRTDAIYHEVRRYDVAFGKQRLGPEGERLDTAEFLKGATLTLLDSSGLAVESLDADGKSVYSWISPDTDAADFVPGTERHVVRIGAGEYTYKETEEPRDYALAAPIRFELSREGVITLKGQTTPLDARVLDMYDKYIAVDTLIENHVSGKAAEPKKDTFAYTASITGLKPGLTYAARVRTRTYAEGADTFTETTREDYFTASRSGGAVYSFTLKDGESATLCKLPTGASVVVTQSAEATRDGAGLEDAYLAAAYTAEARKGDAIKRLSAGEAYLGNQPLATEDTRIDIDQGEITFRFENELKEKVVPVRFIVRSANNAAAISGAALRVTGPDPKEGEERLSSAWISTEQYKRVDLPYDRDGALAYTLFSAYLPYIPEREALTLIVDQDGNVTSSDAEALTRDKDGYVVTVRIAHILVENLSTATNYFLKGAELELRAVDEGGALLKDGDGGDRRIAWSSSDKGGEDLYLPAGGQYIVRKLSAPENYAPLDPTAVYITVDDDRRVGVYDAEYALNDDGSVKTFAVEKDMGGNDRPSASYDEKTETLTLFDRYVETLTIANRVTGTDRSAEFGYAISPLEPGDTYAYRLNEGEWQTRTVDADGRLAFAAIRHGDALVIRDLPRDIVITETKPAGSYYVTDWLQDDTTELTPDDTLERSVVEVGLTGRNTVVVTNRECVARVRNGADGEWSDWTYFEYLASDEEDGAFDYVNDPKRVENEDGSTVEAYLTGDVEIETLWAAHDRYTMTQGFKITNGNISSLAIRSAAALTAAGKRTTIVGQSVGTLLVFDAGCPVEISDLVFEGKLEGSAVTQTSDGGALRVESGDLTLDAVGIHDFATLGSGGAVYAASGTTVTVNAGTEITNCSAQSGGAIYAAHGTAEPEDGAEALERSGAFVMNGGRITGNTTWQRDHAAVEAGEMRFGGAARVIENANAATGTAANVLLDRDSNAVIRSLRLEDDAAIGVYVSDDQFDAHGAFAMPFGTYTVDQNLFLFTNDRNGMYGEADPKSGSARAIVWQSYLCKITDSADRLLYYRDGNIYRDAVFKTLSDAFDNLGNLYTDRAGARYAPTDGAHLAKIKLLVDEFQQPNQIARSEAYHVELTTAAADDGDAYKYLGEGDRAVIRAWDGASDGASLFALSGGMNLTVSNIVIDGNRAGGRKTSVNGGLFSLSGTSGRKTALTLAGGAVLQNAAAQKGAAIYAAGSSVEVYVKDAQISGNTATHENGGAINTVGSSSVNVFFEGDAVVYDNFGSGTLAAQQKNMVLDWTAENNQTIQTTAKGLGDGARIGVYVTGSTTRLEEEPYRSHGGEKDDFGTYDPSNEDNLGRFVNDRNGYFGEADPDHDYLIRWANAVCKITDVSDSEILLYYNSGTALRPVYSKAVFSKLESNTGAVAKLGVLYKKTGNSYTKYTGATKIQMLVDEYELPSTVTIGNYTTTITTAKTNPLDPDDKYPYRGEEGKERAMIIAKAGTTTRMFQLYSNSANVTVENIIIDGNRANRTCFLYGALFNLEVGNTPTLNLKAGATLRNSSSTQQGGAVDNHDGTVNMYAGAEITNCSSSDAFGGGAVHIYRRPAVFNMYGGEITSCTAKNSGGAVTVRTGGVFNMSGGTISNCSAGTSGGAVFLYHHENPIFNMTDGTISGCGAPAGSAVYMDGGTHDLHLSTVNISGGSITGNTVTSAAGGAIQLASGTGSTINLSGAPTIYDNEDSNGKQANIYLDRNDKKIINVIGDGLKGGKIGVWPTNPANRDEGDPFGYTLAKGANGDLAAFINDYQSDHAATQRMLVGAPATNGSAGNVIWKPLICKIVDTSGDAIGTEHVFPTLNAAVAHARTNGNGAAMSSSTNVKIEMLVDYAIPESDKVTLDQAKDNITITTASGGVYTFAPSFKPADGRLGTDSGSTAILKRGYIGESLFTVSSAAAKLSTANIIFDGDGTLPMLNNGVWNWTGTMATENGGLLKQTGGTMNVGAGTILRNSVVKSDVAGNSAVNGGAIYASGGTLSISGARFENCAAQHSGGAVCAENCPVTITKDAATGIKTSFDNCHAIGWLDNSGNSHGNGGAVFATKSLFISEMIATHCHAQENGGAVCVSNGGVEVSLTGSEITDCYTTGTSGGGIYVTCNKLELTGTTVSGCTAGNVGGGLCVNVASGTVTLDNTRIGENRARLGGGIYLNTWNETLACTLKSNTEVYGNYASGDGGGIYVDAASTAENAKTIMTLQGSANVRDNGTKTENGTTVYTANGGGVCLRAKTTLIMEADDSGNSPKITGNRAATAGGGVYVVDGAVLTMKDSAEIGNHEIAGGVTEKMGAGVYLAHGAVMNLEGSPNFNNNRIRDTAYKNDADPVKRNGGETYDEIVRQDIYLAETGAESASAANYTPASLIVTGDLVDKDGNYIGDGSIWVWAADEYRYKQLMPFAKMGANAMFAEKPTGSQFDAAHLKAFRNAQDDETTENGTDTYLFGTNEGDAAGIIYWTGSAGSRKVILRKVDANHTSLNGKAFNIYKGASTTVYTPKDGTQLTGLTSGASGCFWIGNLPYGWYIIEEADPHVYFFLVITESGTYGSLVELDTGTLTNKVGGFADLKDAQDAAKALYDLKK
ncbi:MAG: InlB B-repeat-containing protein, partial [Clostridia bacterium]|nr:InlB B-repeat-containing protein [Clostridia bacterium]